MIRKLLLAAVTATVLVPAAFGPGLSAWGAEPLEVRIRQASLAKDGIVQLVVSIAGAPLGVLPTSSFKVVEEGTDVKELQVAPLIESKFQPIAVSLVMDVSGSTKGKPIEDAKHAAKQFLSQLPGEVEVAVIAFASEALVRQSFTTDRAALAATIDSLQPAGETALYDGVGLAASLLGGIPEAQHNIVVFSDGGDTVSQSTLEQAVAAAVSASAQVTSVGLVTTESDQSALDSLATQTGGTSLPVTESQRLSEAFTRIAKEIASQYVLTYTETRVEPKELDLTVHVSVDGALASDSIVALNPRVPGPKPTPSFVAIEPPPEPLLAPWGLYLGAAAIFLALLLVGSITLRPAGTTAVKVLKRGMKPYAEPVLDIPTTFVTSGLAKRAVGLVDAVPKPKGYEDKLQLLLDRSNWPLRSSEFIVLQALSAFGGLMVGFGLFGRAWMGVLLGLIGAFVPRAILNQRIERRASAFLAQLPDTLQLLSGSLQVGHGLMQAIDTVSKEAGPPASVEFSRVLAEARLGMPLEDSLESMAERIGSEDFRWVVLAINIQKQVGGNLSALLVTVGRTLREREQVRRQAKVLSAEGRLSAWILTLLPFALAVYLALVNPDYVGSLLTTGAGRLMVVGALIAMGVGIAWMRRVVKVEI